MFDVLVVGGGPGGLNCARRLAQSGYAVAVLEEHTTSGQPVHCTGVLAVEAFDEFGLSRRSILNPLATARFFSPAGLSVSHTTRTTEALVVDRALFDQDLHRQALEAGATVIMGHRVTSVDVSADAVTVLAGHRTFTARSAVLACGANYVLHRQLGLGMPGTYLRTAQLELQASRPRDVEIHFGQEVAPQGFAWLVPVDREDGSYARVGVMCSQNPARYFTAFVQRHTESWGLGVVSDTGEELLPRQKMLPLTPIDRTYTDRVLAVGDAAGLVKATTGGGIYYSLVSSTLAADVLSHALRQNTLSAAALAPYEARWRERLGGELHAQHALRTIAERLDDGEIDALFDLAQTNGIMPIVRRTARFNHHRSLIVSLLKHPPVRRLLFKELVSRGSILGTR
jgi:geranylgeranyl reductase family protein